MNNKTDIKKKIAFLSWYPHCKQPYSCMNSLSKKCICPKPESPTYTETDVLNILNIIYPIAAEHGKNNTYFDYSDWFNEIKKTKNP